MNLTREEIQTYRRIQRRMLAAEIELQTAKASLQEYLMDLEQQYDLVLGRDNIDLNTFQIEKGDDA